MQAKEFKKILTDLGIVHYKGTNIPILERLVLTPGKVSVGNLDSVLTFDFDHNITALVDYQRVKKLVAVLDPQDDVNFEMNEDGTSLYLKINNKIEAKYGGLWHLKDYVKHPVKGTFPEVEARVGTIKKSDLILLKEANGFNGNDDLRPAMTCINFGKAIVSTDGHVMYFAPSSQADFPEVATYAYEVRDEEKATVLTEAKDCFWQDLTPEEQLTCISHKEHFLKNLLISDKGVKILIKNAAEVIITLIPRLEHKHVNGKTYMGSDLWMVFESPGFEYKERMMDERFPDYINVIPTVEQDHFIYEFDTKEFMKSSKMADVQANSTTHQMEVRFQNETSGEPYKDFVRILSGDLDFETQLNRKMPARGRTVHMEKTRMKVIAGTEEMEIVALPEPVIFPAIGLNARFVQKVLSNISGKNVSVRMSAANRAAIFDEKFLIMPVMLNNYS